MTSGPIPSLVATLLERLEGRETLELEFKSARGGLPRDVWPTVSAFANTNGGWIVLGVREESGVLQADGVQDASALLQTFYNMVRNPQKVSHPVCGAGDAAIESVGDRQFLVIRVPAASRKARPIYINGNPYGGTYVRRHAGDYQCTKPEVDRMMRDASDVTADSTVLHRYGLDDLDPDSLARFRRRFQTRDPASPWNGYDDRRFLGAIGGYARDRQTGEEGITVAALLLLGRPEAIRDWRARHLIDFRLLPDEPGAGERWDDRVPWDGNILGAFEAIYPRLIKDLPTPFRLQGASRVDETPAHVALREALANLLVHADYAEPQASLVTRSANGYFFRNPGSSRVPESDLLTGDRSDPRNPILLRMFRVIGFADEAGTGIPKITEAWRDLGLQLPRIDAGTERYEFALELHNTHLLSDEDRAWLLALGGQWTEAEQLALVHARHEGFVDNLKLRRMTGEHAADTTKVLVGLRDRGLLQMTRAGRGARYELDPAALAPASRPQGTPAMPARAEPSIPGIQPSFPGMEPSSPGIQPSFPGTEPSFPGTEVDAHRIAERIRELRPELEEIARPVRGTRRPDPALRDEVIVRLCARAPLSLRELTGLLHRNESYLQGVLQALIGSGRLRFLYAARPNHPRQRYVAVDEP